MSPLDFLRAKGDVECDLVSRRAGTTLAYFKQIAYGFRRPSPELARKLEQASDGDLNAIDMAFADTRTPQPAGERAA